MRRGTEPTPATGSETDSAPPTGELVDFVDTHAEAAALARPPLIIREGLAEVIPGEGPLELERFGEGHSNVTCAVRRDGREWILRRPPRPPYPPRAHDVIRECTVLQALAATDVPVPEVLLSHPDPDLIGAPFYVMERVRGHVLRDEIPPDLAGAGVEERIAAELVDGLLLVHAVDWRRLELPYRGGETYLERQVSLWRSQWQRNRVREVAAIDALGRDLAATVPASQGTTLVHGDYKLDNVVFAGSPPRLASILDWEMATVGDPLADLGFLAAMWIGGEGDPESLLGLSRVTALPGFPDRAVLAARYAERSGLDLGALAWYEALAVWKLAILLEGSYRRYLEGTDDDSFFAALREGVPALAEQARLHFAEVPR